MAVNKSILDRKKQQIDDLLKQSEACFRKDYPKAVSLYHKARKSAEGVGIQDLILKCVHKRAFIASYAGKKEDLFFYSDELIDKSAAAKNWYYLEKGWNVKGTYLANNSYYDKALKCFLEAKKIVRRVHNNKTYCLNHRNLGITYDKLGHHDKGISHLRLASKWAKKTGDPLMTASVTYWLGYVLDSCGKYRAAINQHLIALNINLEQENHYGAGLCYNDIGMIYRNCSFLDKQNRQDKALDYFDKAKQCAERCEDARLLADVYNNIGLVYLHRVELNKSLDNYLKSLEFRKISPLKENEAITLQNIGNIYCKLKQDEKAYDYLTRSLAIRKELNHPYHLITCLSNLLEFLARRKMTGQAEEHMVELKKLLQNTKDPQLLLRIYYGFSSYYEAQGNHLEALEAYKKGVEYERELYPKSLVEQLNNEEQKHKVKIDKLKQEINISREKVKAAEAMACTTCHKINQPLMVAQGYLEMLMNNRDHSLGSEKNNRYLEKIQQAIESIKQELKTMTESKDIQFSPYIDEVEMVTYKKEHIKKRSG